MVVGSKSSSKEEEDITARRFFGRSLAAPRAAFVSGSTLAFAFEGFFLRFAAAVVVEGAGGLDVAALGLSSAFAGAVLEDEVALALTALEVDFGLAGDLAFGIGLAVVVAKNDEGAGEVALALTALTFTALTLEVDFGLAEAVVVGQAGAALTLAEADLSSSAVAAVGDVALA